jgi:type IV pilus assembly protein PilY1
VILTIGSGDREHPLYTNYPYTAPVTNHFYAFTDLITQPVTVLNLDGNDLQAITNLSTPTTTCLPENRGWRLSLAGGNGEQVVTSSLIAGGKVFFNTNKATAPAVGVCTNDLGEARGYNVDLFCGGGFAVNYIGGGLPISPVLGQVELGDGTVATVVIGAPGSDTTTNPFTPFRPPVAISPQRSRLYWYRPGDR